MGKDHKAVVIPALENGKHVFVEKPIADTLEDAEAMVETAKRVPGKFMVGHICRFQPQYLQAKEMINTGKLGNISMIQTHRNNHYTTLVPGRKLGPLRETAIHDIDLALWLTESNIESSYGYKRYNQSDKEADSCLTIAKLSNGTICSFASSWLSRDAMPAGVDAMMKIIGTKGEIEIHHPPQNFKFVDDKENSCFNPETSLNPLILKQTALTAEIEYFLKCILEDKTPKIITPKEALCSLKAAIRIDESCEVIK